MTRLTGKTAGLTALAIAALALAWWLLSPLFLSTRVEENLPGVPGAGGAAPSEVRRLKSGLLQDADSFHKGSGEATILRAADGSALLRLDRITVTNGPDLHVFLTPHPKPATQSEAQTTGYVDLGPLKANPGSHNYPIPGATNLDAQQSVVIYCLPFNVVFSTARLQPVS